MKLMCSKGWKKKLVYNLEGIINYDCTKKDYTINVSIGRKQGYPGSNQVNAFGGHQWGGWVQGTPKNFKDIKSMNIFIKKISQELDKDKLGHKVAFPE